VGVPCGRCSHRTAISLQSVFPAVGVLTVPQFPCSRCSLQSVFSPYRNFPEVSVLTVPQSPRYRLPTRSFCTQLFLSIRIDNCFVLLYLDTASGHVRLIY
jgi:hypothetical protein